MRCTLRLLRGLWRDRRGATAIEYGILLAMIAIAISAAVAGLGDVNGGIWNGVATNVIAHSRIG
ncbi:hypothetical protein ASE73_07960 [Sphingomonas sp. Leaf24]|uniref:Flp family type IVb pilin n=1 Tax=unclassified Sphingomonas TaxID=196159 RepID=UPI0006F2A486|nr:MULTISPECIES: Flp family type IVb pilin [unclassified Sphingomonas]KQM17993.1 hypothetical protein ASE50_06000 [Sphingomonas sp. Leaf5]KQM88974.1 hypothetical protein ASE73_07960 [Sphingomonas sp. Leaf24]